MESQGPMVLKYRTGEEIIKGDRVRYNRNPATIEVVATPPGDQETDWYVQEYGGGMMIVESTVLVVFLFPPIKLTRTKT